MFDPAQSQVDYITLGLNPNYDISKLMFYSATGENIYVRFIDAASKLELYPEAITLTLPTTATILSSIFTSVTGSAWNDSTTAVVYADGPINCNSSILKNFKDVKYDNKTDQLLNIRSVCLLGQIKNWYNNIEDSDKLNSILNEVSFTAVSSGSLPLCNISRVSKSSLYRNKVIITNTSSSENIFVKFLSPSTLISSFSASSTDYNLLVPANSSATINVSPFVEIAVVGNNVDCIIQELS